MIVKSIEIQSQSILNLTPSLVKVGNSIVMSLICVFIENQISWHTHWVGMIAAHIPIAYLHESFTPIQQSKVKQVLLGIWWFFAFHGWLHVLAEQIWSCSHDEIERPIHYLWQARLNKIKELHAHTHWMNIKMRVWVLIWAVWEEIYSRLPLKKVFCDNQWKYKL